MVSYCAPRRRRCFRGCADGTRGVHVSAHRPAPAVQPRGSSTAHPSVPDLPPSTPTQPASQPAPSDERAPYCQPAAGRGAFVTGMLGKCVRLAVLHVCFSPFGPTKTRFCCFLVFFWFFYFATISWESACVAARQEASARCAGRRTRLPGSYFVVLLPLTRPEPRLSGNGSKPERRDKLRSGFSV